MLGVNVRMIIPVEVVAVSVGEVVSTVCSAIGGSWRSVVSRNEIYKDIILKIEGFHNAYKCCYALICFEHYNYLFCNNLRDHSWSKLQRW